MNKSIFNLIEKTQNNSLVALAQEYASANKIEIGEKEGQLTVADVKERMDISAEYLYALFTGRNYEGKSLDVPQISFTEMTSSSDASILLPRVISEVLLEPKEPNLFLSNNAVEEITLEAKSPLWVTFPAVSALQAFEIGEGQEYKSQALSFQEHMTSIRLKKIGLQVSLTEEIVSQSIYPLIRLNLKLANAAIDRKVESTLFTALTQRANEVFNNDDGSTTDRTSGVDVNQAWNGSLALKDILKLASVVVGNRYEPSHILVHPLAYFTIFQDPIIRATFYHQGQLGGSIWKQGPNFDQSQNMPFGITYVPYYALPYSENYTLTTNLSSGLGTALTTDMYVIDSKNTFYMATRGGTEIDEMDDWFKDAMAMKARRYVGVSVKDGGKAMTVARNIRMVENFQPIFTVRNTV